MGLSLLNLHYVRVGYTQCVMCSGVDFTCLWGRNNAVSLYEEC
jgi:hypothetical protein